MPAKTVFVCSSCDAQFAKWSGRCLECGAWGTIGDAPVAVNNTTPLAKSSVPPPAIGTLGAASKKSADTRIPSGSTEVDRVLGGGLVRGSLTLLGGDPGIGKTTLALRVAAHIPGTLYVSAEETANQVRAAAERCGLHPDKLLFLQSASLDEIASGIEHTHPPVAVIDSIQTVSLQDVAGEKGSVTQVRACTARLLEVAKKNECAVIIIGHVTKDGAVAGPKTLEHLVDTVLYFEGDPERDVRILRSVKNRFGSTNEIGIFEMAEQGLHEVLDPSRAATAHQEALPGSIIACAIEGTRPLLIEIQALVHKTSFGYPERRASGFDTNRLKLLLAVMESRAGLALGTYDVHVNVVGGVRLKEPAMDLPVALALASAFKSKALPRTIAAFGEIDLSGNIRPVAHTQKRIDECLRLGMKKIILPSEDKWKQKEVLKIKNIAELVKHAS